MKDTTKSYAFEDFKNDVKGQLSSDKKNVLESYWLNYVNTENVDKSLYKQFPFGSYDDELREKSFPKENKSSTGGSSTTKKSRKKTTSKNSKRTQKTSNKRGKKPANYKLTMKKVTQKQNKRKQTKTKSKNVLKKY